MDMLFLKGFKMRIAFTIALNAEHHLKHNNYAEKVADWVDLWVIVEGAAKSNGSTKWCKEMLPEYCTKDGHSVDGTLDFLKDLNLKNKNVVIVKQTGMWDSKDEMVNKALETIGDLFNYICSSSYVFLWEIDADEQWELRDMISAETSLYAENGTTGMFYANHYVGKNLLARGEWGEGKIIPYKRLWIWSGERFISHEPPEMDFGETVEILLPQRFNHYAYYFEKDVKFKNDWYSGHEGVLQKWLDLQKETCFPQPISRLISGHWGTTNTQIIQTK
jgi:hypothetical protein